MRISAQKRTLLLVPIAASFLACLLLSGCDGKKTGEVVNATLNDFQHGLATDDRAAIQKVDRAISDAFDKLDPNASSLEETQKAFDQLYEVLLAVNVSACPKDYRDQYAKMLDSLRVFSEVLDKSSVKDDDETVLSRIKKPRQDMYQQISELKSIVHRYGAD